MEQHLTCRQAANLTSTSESFWRKLAARRTIRSFKLGRATRLREADVLRYIAEHERAGRSSGQ
jgi:excisionase family DNA binding protein